MTRLRERVEQVDLLLHAHAGGIELREADDSGRVRLRYTGMCTGCPFKALTTEATVRPLLMELEEVTAVEIDGGRVSEEALRRLRAALGPQSCPAVPALAI
jgi:Fe-S cluster biogenesis protein NfuA